MILLLLCLMGLAKSNDPHLLYFILVDRFENGSSDNDENVLLSSEDELHGGDLKGISNKIEHLKSMGVDWIWLSPVFEFRKDKFDGHAAFHGYWTKSLDRVEPHFGGDEALINLSSKLKTEGIGLVLDMVYNHVAMDSIFTKIHPDWFHPPKEIKDWNNIEDLTTGSVHGLPDLNQSRESLYMYFHHRTQHWLKETNAVGIRIDALKHMNTGFIKRLRTDLKNKNPAVQLLGEDFDGNPITLAQRARETTTDSLFDFPMHYAMTDVFCKQSPVQRLAVMLSMDDLYPKGLKLITFLDNHDLPRIDSLCTKDKDVENALAFQFGIRGLPMITYGFEAKLNGLKEPQNRRDMPWKHIDTKGRVKAIKALRDLRARHTVLENGTGYVEELKKDWLVYVQENDTEKSILVFNASQKAHSLTFKSPILAGWTSATMEETLTPRVEANSVAIFVTQNQKSKEAIKEQVIQFEIEGSKSPPIVVGSTTAFGLWDPHKGLKLTQHQNKWIGTAKVQKGKAIAWKLVTIDENKVQWEPGENRILWKQTQVKERLRQR